MVSRTNQLIQQSSSGCSFDVVGDMFVKHLTWDLNNKWLKTYKALHKFQPKIVEVYHYEDRKIYMQHINGTLLKNNMSLNGYKQAIDILESIYNFSIDNNISFLHRDTHMGNFIVESETSQVYLIDPDSFHFYEA